MDDLCLEVAFFGPLRQIGRVNVDVLTEIMDLVRTKGQLYGRLERTAPFGLEFPAGKGICLIVTRGACVLGVDDLPLTPLVGGDFVFLPAPDTHSLRNNPGTRLRSVRDVTTPGAFQRSRLIRYGGGGTPT